MPDPVAPKAFRTLVQMSINSMYELEAIGELLEQKGVMTKHESMPLAKELKRKAPTSESRTAATSYAPSP
jgi:hypothetical protein